MPLSPHLRGWRAVESPICAISRLATMLEVIEGRPFRFVGQDPAPGCDFWALRDWCSGLGDMSLVGDPDRFLFSGWGLHMGPAILAECWSTTVLHDRSPIHVSRGNIDHFQISIYFRGGCHIEHRRGSATADAGDIAILDMAQPG